MNFVFSPMEVAGFHPKNCFNRVIFPPLFTFFRPFYPARCLVVVTCQNQRFGSIQHRRGVITTQI